MDALVLVVLTRGLSRLHRFGGARLGDVGSGFAAPVLLTRFIEADQRSRRVVRSRVDVEHVLHRVMRDACLWHDEAGVGFRRDYPVVGQVRFEVVFLSAQSYSGMPTVLKCAVGTIWRSTSAPASRRMVQRG
jgi:hypothetical protein